MIAIKGMEEIPSCCRHCPCSDNLQCNLITQYNDLKGRPNDCPLVEIITCKECKNYVKGALDEEICLKGHELIHEDFYCADGERRK